MAETAVTAATTPTRRNREYWDEAIAVVSLQRMNVMCTDVSQHRFLFVALRISGMLPIRL
jgi:hypothetical protein